MRTMERKFSLWAARLLVFLAIIAEAKPSLYKKEDPVVSLDYKSFFRVVFGSRTIWCVEFYQSGCGTCRTYAPTYLSLARDVKAWDSVVRVAAIDCSAEVNVPICRHFGIESVPSIHFFYAFSKNITDGKANLGVEHKGEKDAHLLAEAIVDIVRNQPRRPTRWPRMTPLSIDEAKDISGRQHQHQMKAIIFEDENSYIGQQLILDVLACRNLFIYRVMKSKLEIVHLFGASSFPSLLLFGHGQPHFISSNNNTRAGYRSALLQLCGHQPPAAPERKSSSHSLAIRRLPRTHIQPAVHMQDLISTLVYIIHREVPLHSALHGAPLHALSKFLQAIHQCLPAPSHVAQHINYILRQLKLYSKGGVVMQTWKLISARHTATSWMPVKIEWKGCQGSMPHHRGYTCGLWTLFHTMTAHCLLATEGGAMAAGMHRYSVRLHRGNEAAALFAIGRRRPSSMDSRTALLAIRDYVKYFFACADCRKHFLAASVNLASEVKNGHDAVMWLWKMHNSVNHRVAKDPSTDPLFPKVQFPLISLCDDCRAQTNEEEEPKHLVWDRSRVFSFLLQFYGPSGIHWGTEPEDHRSAMIEAHHHHQPHPLASAVFFMSFSFVGLLAIYYWFKATYPHIRFSRLFGPRKKKQHMV